MTPEEKVRRGQAAQRVLDDPLFEVLTKAIEAECFEHWVNTPPDRASEREDLHRMIRCHTDYARLLNKWKGEAVFEIKETERKLKQA